MTNEEKIEKMLKFFHGSRTLKDLLLEMAEWKEQQMIEKACEWLKDNAGDSYLDWYDWEECRLNKEELLYDFRKAMKGGEK